MVSAQSQFVLLWSLKK